MLLRCASEGRMGTDAEVCVWVVGMEKLKKYFIHQSNFTHTQIRLTLTLEIGSGRLA
jgi:hypothetical protein